MTARHSGLLKGNAERARKAEQPPGTPVYIGEPRTAKPRVTLIDYDEKQFSEQDVTDVKICLPFVASPSTTWVNVDGLQDVSVIEELGQCFGMHPLVQEDIVNTTQRPKVEDLGDYIFIVVRMLSNDEKTSVIKSEQVSLILGKHFVLTFQEDPGDVWDAVRERLRQDKGRIRHQGADALAYSLIDAIVDSYFSIMETQGEKIEDLEERLVVQATPVLLSTIHFLKSDLITLRRAIWPLRDVVDNLNRSENNLLSKNIRIYFRDLYDHTVQIIDTVETFRDMVSGMLDIYLSSVSNRLNEIIKTLTIVSIPLAAATFFASIWGMNFKHMPELAQTWGYPLALAIMFGSIVAFTIYFRRRKWF